MDTTELSKLVRDAVATLDNDLRTLIKDVANVRVELGAQKGRYDSDLESIKVRINDIHRAIYVGNGQESLVKALSRIDERLLALKEETNKDVAELEARLNSIEKNAANLLNKTPQEDNSKASDSSLSSTMVSAKKEIWLAIIGVIGSVLAVFIPLAGSRNGNGEAPKTPPQIEQKRLR